LSTAPAPPRSRDRPRLLVLYAHYSPTLSYYDDWLGAFRGAADQDVTTIDLCRRGATRRVAAAAVDHDAVVLLHSTNGDTLEYLAPVVPALDGRRGPLLSFVGNEVNLPGSPMAEKIDLLGQLQADWVVTQHPLECGVYLYAESTGSRVAAVPHALEPSVFAPRIEDADRDIDIGVRAARYTPYLGDDDRNRVLEAFANGVFDPPLKVDVSTDERLPREGWAAFLNRSRGTVATEAGSWYLQRDDAIVNRVRDYVLEQQRAAGGVVIAADSPLRRLGHRLPWRVRSLLRKAMRKGPIRHEAALNDFLDHSDIYARFFADQPRAPVYTKCISSRHFDAIGTGTCQILLRGRYNDILVPDEHYLPLDQDFGNLDAVVERFRNPVERRRIAATALEFALAGHTYAHRVRQVNRLLFASTPAPADLNAALIP
jgi:hypothetical protein